MLKQSELFAAPPIVPGLLLVEEAMSERQESGLETHIDAAPLAPFQFGQWEGKRLTTHYGSGYDFGRQRVAEAPPLPAWLLDLRERLAPQVGLEPTAFEAALLIRYDPGAGIGWHRDRPQYGEVMGLSLSAPCVLRLRRRTSTGFERRAIDLPRRSLYLLSGEVRREWEHSIVPLEVTRRSVTFRSLA
jgi:alkylated DNA repair protein (DNA oxidative demethylase)